MRVPTENNHDSRDVTRRNLWIAFALTSSYMLAEIVGGLMANSLALLADAVHMLTDVAALGLAVLAIWVASRPASARRTFGFQRAEVLAALFNALSLWMIAGWIFVEAFRRFQELSEVRGTLMLGVGFGGLMVNLATIWVLRHSAKENLNVEGAFLHVLGDLLGSIAVVTGGLLIIGLGWSIADPILGVLIGILILASSTRLLWKVVHVLMQGTPHGLDLNRLCQKFEQVAGVAGVHDIHVWSLTTGYQVLSAHVISSEIALGNREHLLKRLREIASREFGVGHVTIQLESSKDGCEERHHTPHREV